MPDPAVGGAPHESQLAEAASKGDRDAFAQLVERYQNQVCSLAYAMIGSFAQSEEIAQEAFLVAWRRFPDLRAPYNFRSWLYGIVHNVSRDFRRRQRSLWSLHTGAAAAAADLPAAVPTPLDRMISAEEERVLWRALAEVPESYRIPLVLFYREEKSIERIARVLDLSEDNVRQRLARGRQRLQQTILQVLESALRRTLPGKSFTAGVVAALVALAGGSAEASPRESRPWRRALPRRTLLLGGGAAVLLPLALIPFLGRDAFLPGTSQALHTRASSGEGAVRNPKQSLAPRSAPGASRPSEPAPTAAVPAATVFSFDFEDGSQFPNTNTGHVGPCPGRPGHCLIATLHPLGGYWAADHVQERTFPYSPGWVLSFDYWLGAGPKGLVVQMGNVTRGGGAYYLRPKNVVHEAWTRVELPFSEVYTNDGTPPGWQEGDEINTFGFVTRLEQHGLYIDNVKLVDTGVSQTEGDSH